MAFYPGESDWNNFDGDYTLSNNNQRIDFTGTIKSQWHDSVSGVSRIDIDGSVSGILVRSSSAKPDTRVDRIIVLPDDDEWQTIYDPSLGTLPTSQGFSLGTGGAPAVGEYSFVNGRLRVTRTGAYDFRKFPAGISQSRVVIFKYSITVHSGTTHQLETYFGTDWGGGRRFDSMWKGSLYGSVANTWACGATSTNRTFAYETEYDVYHKIEFSASYAFERASMFWRPRGSNSEFDLVDLYSANDLAGTVGTAQNIMLFGNFSGGTSDATWGAVKVWYGSEWETAIDGQTSFTNNRRYWQINPVSGYLTELDISSNLSAPGNVSTSSEEVFGTNAISIVNDSVSGANGYDYRLIRTSDDVEVQRKYDYDNGVVFTDVPDGTYKVEIRAFTDDGIRSASALSVTGLVIPEPSIPNPIIAIAVTDNLIAGGETSSLTYAVQSGIDFYLNGSLTSGSGSIVAVTGQVVDTIVNLDVSPSEVAAGEESTLTWATSGAVSVSINGLSVADSGSQVVVTGETSAVTPPNAPTSINVISEPNRPTYIGVL